MNELPNPLGSRQTRNANGLYEALFSRIPPEARASFTDAQRLALHDAALRCQWGQHPVDIRLTLPGLFGRFYVSLVGGRERRNAERLREERKRHPLWTRGNSIVLVPAASVLLGAGVFAGMALINMVRSF